MSNCSIDDIWHKDTLGLNDGQWLWVLVYSNCWAPYLLIIDFPSLWKTYEPTCSFYSDSSFCKPLHWECLISLTKISRIEGTERGMRLLLLQQAFSFRQSLWFGDLIRWYRHGCPAEQLIEDLVDVWFVVLAVCRGLGILCLVTGYCLLVDDYFALGDPVGKLRLLVDVVHHGNTISSPIRRANPRYCRRRQMRSERPWPP